MKRFTLSFLLTGALWQLSYTQEALDPRILEVYGQEARQLQLKNPGWAEGMQKLLTERIHYVESIQTDGEKYPKLSEFELLNHNNPDLKRDETFDPAAFNPLKYNLSFFSGNTMVYRIDGTSYLLVIEPQH